MNLGRIGKWSLLLVLVSLVIGITACGGSKDVTSEKVVIGYPAPSISYLPLIVADKQGFFVEEKLEVEFIQMGTGELMAALISGDVDFTTAIPDLPILVQTQNMPLKGILVTSGKPQHTLIVQPGITSFEQLKGKKIGVNGKAEFTQYEVEVMLRKHGIQPNDVVFMGMKGSGERLAALQGKAIDAAILPVPSNFQAINNGFKELSTSADLPDIVLAGLGTSEKKIKDERQMAIRVVRAALKGIEYTFSHPEETKKIMAEWLKLTPEVADASYKVGIQTWSKDGKSTDQTWLAALEIAKINDPNVKMNIPVKDLVDWTLINDARKK